MDKTNWTSRVKPFEGKVTGTSTASDWGAPIGTAIPKEGGKVYRTGGYVSKEAIEKVALRNPEPIIPLNQKERGEELWAKALEKYQ